MLVLGSCVMGRGEGEREKGAGLISYAKTWGYLGNFECKNYEEGFLFQNISAGAIYFSA